ncbi:MAG: hypothetical protein V2I76_09495 [Roseobacter sp.]|jgi:hypothetical protein|nr:hypothetical protein [Roseobacter sp.]
MSSTALRPVRRRRVFYIPGYDPFPPRRYRELYRKEAAAQAAISGYTITFAPVRPRAGFGWQVRSQIDGHEVETGIEVLTWSDIVQGSRPHSVLATYVDLLRTAWIYISTGALFRLMRLRKGPVIAALYPVVALVMQFFAALALAWALFRVIGFAALDIWGGDAQLPATVVGTVMGLWVFASVLRWFQRMDGQFFAYYLMHDFAFSAAESGAYADVLETRLTVFRARIVEALQGDADEVLVVGHSSGAHLGVSLLADILRKGERPPEGPALAFLSLGHVVPMLTFLPQAYRLRGDLRVLSACPDIAWVDITAPGDGCCFALCDPVAISGQSTPDKTGPLVFSAAFTQSLSPERWKALRWRFFRLHFQYLCAFDRPKDYDYFQITAGPQRLADRYDGRSPSRSRIERTVTGYTAARL